MALWIAVLYAPIMLVMLLNRPTTRGSAAGPLFVPAAMLVLLVAVATLIPNLSLLVRRLHDANFSGWFAVLGLIPWLGGLAIFIFSLMSSNPLGALFDKNSSLTTAQPTWQSPQRLG